MKKKKDERLHLTTRSHHTVMAMVELAQRSNDGPVPLAQIAKESNISLSYLEQIFSDLRRSGLVKSFRGPGGGYVLARPAKDIVVADILVCSSDGGEERKASNGNRQTRALWDHMGEFRLAYLRHISLEDVTEGRLDAHPITHKLFQTLR